MRGDERTRTRPSFLEGEERRPRRQRRVFSTLIKTTDSPSIMFVHFVSYCVPGTRTPLVFSVMKWKACG